MDRHERYMKILEKIAETVEPVRSSRLAAAIVKGNNILGIGQCSMKSHPLQARHNCHPDAIYSHAEIAAIASAIKHNRISKLIGSTIYVVRMKNDGRGNMIRGTSKPCEGCMSGIRSFGISKIYYFEDFEMRSMEV